MADIEHLHSLARLMRSFILRSTTTAGSGHPTSSLSAVELMAALFFGGHFRFFPDDPGHPNNDRLLFSKGHATPLLYALWAAAGQVSEDELMTYREFGSPLEGHPSIAFRYTEAATGSLGQGLSIGLGMALNARYLDKLPYRTFVLLGDSEMAEGSQWEAVQLAAHYELDNLIGVLDVNRLGQRGETMYGHDLAAYGKRLDAFGWKTVLIEDGHDFEQVLAGYEKALRAQGGPVMLIARTIKGKGVPLVEDENGWHGKALEEEECRQAIEGLGEIDSTVRGNLTAPEDLVPEPPPAGPAAEVAYQAGQKVATRNAYGTALNRIYPAHPGMVVLDGEVSNSTRAGSFKKEHPERFFEMFIAEQNMLGAALGLARRGKLPFVSSFSAFLSRAYDQIRMNQYSEPHMIVCGSHAGVSIGQDGPSQMGLEDIAFFRTLQGSSVLYPSDAVSCEKLVEAAAGHQGIVYIRTTRGGTPILYGPEEDFPIGGCKVLHQSDEDLVTLVGAGITLHECLAARESLAGEGISVRVIDLYSVKPVDTATLAESAQSTLAVITVEDHSLAGGLGEAVLSALAHIPVPVHCLGVTQKPKSGKPEQLLDFEGLAKDSIIAAVREVL
ncbi:MAG: transketolase [Desulfohalobiaceae bacterium]